MKKLTDYQKYLVSELRSKKRKQIADLEDTQCRIKAITGMTESDALCDFDDAAVAMEYACTKKDALLKFVLSSVFGGVDKIDWNIDESQLVEDAISVIEGLREDALLLEDATSRANKAEVALSKALPDIYKAKKIVSIALGSDSGDGEDEGEYTSSCGIRAKVSYMAASADTAGAGHNKLDACIKKASEKGGNPTINGSEREWREFVKQLVQQEEDKRHG